MCSGLAAYRVQPKGEGEIVFLVDCPSNDLVRRIVVLGGVVLDVLGNLRQRRHLCEAPSAAVLPTPWQ